MRIRVRRLNIACPSGRVSRPIDLYVFSLHSFGVETDRLVLGYLLVRDRFPLDHLRGMRSINRSVLPQLNIIWSKLHW